MKEVQCTLNALWCLIVSLVLVDPLLEQHGSKTFRQALILPCLGRTERDLQKSGEQFVSVENSMGGSVGRGRSSLLTQASGVFWWKADWKRESIAKGENGVRQRY